MKPEHPTQKKLFDLLLNELDSPPTFREMKIKLGLSSTSIVAHHLVQLEKAGFIKRNPNNPRDIQVIIGAPENRIINMNLYGLAQCGNNGSLFDNKPIETLPIPSRLLSFPSSEGFIVKAKGDSMAPKINDGDLVIAKKTDNYDSHRIYVCVNNGQALIKKVLVDNKNNVILESINPKHSPFLADNDFSVIGEVKIIISHSI